MANWKKAGNVTALANMPFRGKAKRQGEYKPLDGYFSENGRIMLGHGQAPHYVEAVLLTGETIAMNLDTYQGVIGKTAYSEGAAVRDLFSPANQALMTEIQATPKAPKPVKTVRAIPAVRTENITMTIKANGDRVFTGLTAAQVLALLGQAAVVNQAPRAPVSRANLALEGIKALLG
jgi:hypothetical protein